MPFTKKQLYKRKNLIEYITENGWVKKKTHCTSHAKFNHPNIQDLIIVPHCFGGRREKGCANIVQNSVRSVKKANGV